MNLLRRFVGIMILSLTSAWLAKAANAQPSNAIPALPPGGQLVDVGGYNLYLNVTGAGNPAVVLIAGAGDYSFDWSLVQPEVSRFARVCSYDRCGFGWSDLGPTPRTMKQEVHELHLALKNVGLQPPYVLAGHSVGGLVARVYAEELPSEVAGIALVGVIVGASLQYYFSRSTEHRKRLYELRAGSYVDYLASLAANAVANRTVDEALKVKSRLQAADAKARISIYGSNDVVAALAKSDRSGAALDDQTSIDLFVSACQTMRSESVGDTNLPSGGLSQLLVGGELSDSL